MIQISALNDSSSDESDAEPQYESTKEAQEANGFALYNKALGLQRTGHHGDAERVFQQLLNSHLLMSAVPPEDPEKPGGLVQPGLILKYSTYKNLGSIAFQRQDLSQAMEYYLEAASLDSTDVTLWFKIGTVALDLHHLPLARVAFQQGLTCNQKHWPCLDQLCTVLYALNDYATCLYYICKALERDPTYTKGLALRDQIFSEQPSFRRDSYHMFRHCDDSIHNAKVKKEAAEKVIKEALTLRKKKQELQLKPPSPVLKFLTPLREFTWKALGDKLIALYDHISDRVPELSMGCTIDVAGSVQETTDRDQCQEVDIPMDVDTTKPSPSIPSQGTLLSGAGEGGGPADCEVVSSSEEKSSSDVNAASDVPGQSQGQAQPCRDTPQLQLGSRLEVENGQGDAGVTQQITHDQQQQMGDQQVHPAADESAAVAAVVSGEQSSAVEDITSSQAGLDQPVAMETDGAPEGKQKKRRGPKRKRGTGFELDEMYGGKRRSARVRNTTKKKEEVVSVNYAELLQRFLPSSLTDSSENDDESQDGVKMNQEETTPNAATPSQQHEDKPCEFDTTEFLSTEEADVKQFLKEHEDNAGIVDILHYYLVELAAKYKLKWPDKLSDVYVKGFERLRKHCCFPEILSSDASVQYRRGVGEMLLVYAELKLDQWLLTRAKTSSTPKKSSISGSTSATDDLKDFPGQFFIEDMGYIEDMAYLPSIAGDNWKTYAIRANWMKSRYLILEGKPEMSIDFFDECTDLLTTETDEEEKPKTVCLPNCIQDNIISIDKIKEQKKSLERCQSLEEVHRLHGEEDYRQVVKLLLPTVMQPRMVTAGGEAATESSVVVPERLSQLELLFEALLKLQEFSQCVVCAAVSLAETWQGYMSAKSSNAREEWTGLLIHILEVLNKALSQGIQVLLTVERSRLVELTTILISIIEHAMEGAEMETTQPLTTLLPWIVLYRLIKLQEDKLHKMQISTGSPARSGSPVPMMSSSLMLLETAHEYLGRHSWCCNSNGALLKLYVTVLKTEMDKISKEDSHPFQDNFQLVLEQCFYCLYAHPNRRSKARHLQDHGVEEVPLAWEAAGNLFDFFKPKVVPEFDSYKANSMSADLESLFLKIAKIIPDEEDPINTMESVQAYMEGNSEKAPSVPKDKQDDRHVVKEIHYFLADFYFKNKEFGKAIKFYTLDLCACPDRLDSWAGVALSRSGRLDLKLNACDSKTESPIYKNSVSALRCFKRALEIDESNLALWIEYGSLAYTLHSHASRQLKQHHHLRLSDETKELLRDKREEMLELAGNCFRKASECKGDGDEEEWLVQYMLGKVAEKRHTQPGVYLRHYMEAAHHLYENEAKYPKKITYHNPPDLSLEALEMYYRLHASILKLLEKQGKESPDEYAVLNEFVMKASDTPFVKAKGKKNSDQSDMSEFDFDGKSSSGQRSRLSSSGTPMSPAYLTPQDHDYIKKKSKKKKRNVSQEILSTETASEGEVLSGDDTNSSLSQSAGAAQLLKSLADLKSKDGATTTTTETSTSEAEGGHTETESSQDESPCRDPKRVKIDNTVEESMKSSVEEVSDVEKQTDKDATVGAESVKDDSSAAKKQIDKDVPAEAGPKADDKKDDSAKTAAPVPVGIIKVNPDVSEGSNQDNKEPAPMESDSEPEIIDIISDSDSPVRSKSTKATKIVKKKENKAATVEAKKQVSSPSGGKEDAVFIDLTVDSSDSESLMSTPPRRALHETPIKVKPPSDKDGKKKEDGGGEKDVDGVEPMEVDSEAKSDKKGEEKEGAETMGESKEKTTDATRNQTQDKTSSESTKKPAAERTSGPKSQRTALIDGCIEALSLCLSRFPQHYKSLYRLAQAYFRLGTHKNLQWSRDLLLGTPSSWQHEGHMPSPALFGEHSKTKNLFQGIWRIPITEIDRSGSFPWHMYRSVLLLLEVLEHLQDHQMLLQVAIKLNKIPEQEKKYLRDMDRQYLAQQSYLLCLAVLQQQISEANDEDKKLSALLVAHKVWQCVQGGKLQETVEVPANILKDAFRAYKGSQVESQPSVLEQAVRFCAYYNMVNKLPQTPTSSSDIPFPGRSPRDSWCGSPVRGSRSETMFSHLTSPSYHDNKTTPEFPTTTPPRKLDSGVSQDVRKPFGGLGTHSLSATDFQSAYREALTHKSKDSVKPKAGSVTVVPHATNAAAGLSQSKPTLGKVPATQGKDSAGVKMSAVTGKPIVKLRTLSSMGIKVKPSDSESALSKGSNEEAEMKSTSKDLESASKGHQSLSAQKIHSEESHKKLQQVATSGQAVSSLHQTAPQLHPVAKSTTSAASASVVQRLREALGTKKVEASKSKAGFTSKLSLHREHAKQPGESSLGSHSNRPVSSTAAMSSSRGVKPVSTASMPPLSHSQSRPSGSHGIHQGSFGDQSSSGQSQQQDKSSKKDGDPKSNFMSSFLSFLGGDS